MEVLKKLDHELTTARKYGNAMSQAARRGFLITMTEIEKDIDVLVAMIEDLKKKLDDAAKELEEVKKAAKKTKNGNGKKKSKSKKSSK